MLSEEQHAFHWDRPTSYKYLTFTMRQLIEKYWKFALCITSLSGVLLT